GKLIAEGTETDSITFTSISPEKFTYDDVTTGGGCWDGIDFSSSSGSSMKFCKISNAKTTASGGAIYASTSNNLKIENCNIFNNYAKTDGAAIYAYKSHYLNIDNCNFTNNNSNSSGGAVYTNSSNYFKIGNSNFSENSSAYNGGAVGTYLGISSNISNNIFNKNNSVSDGGAINLYNTQCNIIGNLLVENEAGNCGGGIYDSGYLVTITNNTLSKNRASKGGALSIGKQYYENIINNLFYGNTAAEYGAQISIEKEAYYDIIFSNNDIEGGFEGFGGAGSGVNFIGEYTDNINIDPGFAGQDNYRLVSNSACVNAGTADTSGLNLPAYDLDNNPRISMDVVDIGAYEFQDDANRVNKVEFSHNEKIYPDAINVTLSCSTSDAKIYYTLDGSDPEENSVLYSEPILISNILKVKAKAFKEEMSPSFVVDRIYCIGDTLSGIVTGTIPNNNKPYFVTSDLIINDSTTVTLAAGVELFFMDNYKFNVKGTILAEGSPADSIKFNSLYMFDNSPKWNGILFENNTENDTSRFNYCKFSNSSQSTGGAIYICGSKKIQIENSYVHNNTSTWDGGGLYADESEGIIIKNNVFESNNTEGCGGAICIYTAEDSEITNNQIRFNKSDYSGGGISLTAYDVNSFIFKGNIISNNNSKYDCGGGLYLEGYNLEISNNELLFNESYDCGGAVSMFSCDDIIFANNLISGNSSISDGGGGIYCGWSNNSYFVNNLITNNSSTYDEGGYGGGIALDRSNTNLINNTIVNNKSFESSGISYSGNNVMSSFSNNIIYYNQSEQSEQISIYKCASKFYNNDIQGGFASISVESGIFTGEYINNIDTDPGFVSQGGYNLASNSACINAGTHETSGLNLPEFDLNGNPRISVGRIDIGAYEYQHDGNIVSNVEFSHAEGIFPSDINVSLSCSTPDARIYYTLDGCEPDVNSLLYSEPVLISNISIFKAKAFKDDFAPGFTEKRVYCIGDTLAGTLPGIVENNNKPYFITGDLLVEDQATVTLEPGVKFYFTGNYKIDVKGTIIAEGTSTDSIRFNTFNLIDSSKKWAGILFENNTENDTSKFDYCVFENSKRTESGGAVCITGSKNIIIEDSYFRNNIVDSPDYYGYDGGGLAVINSEGIVVSKNIFESNKAKRNGGGVYIAGCSNSEFTNNIVRNNYSYSNGGGFYLNGSGVSTFSFSNNTITNNNSAKSGGGGAIEQYYLTVNENNISSNTSIYGGGVYINSCDNINITNNIVNHNIASDDIGGGIYCSNSNNSYIVDNLIHSNSSSGEYGRGGGIALYNSSSNIVNNSIVNNNSNFGGSGIYFAYCYNIVNARVVNNIIYFNQSTNQDQILINDSNYQPNFYNNDIQGGKTSITGGGGGSNLVGMYLNNIDKEPGFVGQEDYNLSLSSPCMNAGIADTLGLNLPEFDLSGKPRISNIIDMGAYENESGEMLVSDVNFSINKSWCYYGEKLRLTCDTSGALIYYTLDGTVPDEMAILYTDSIPMVNKNIVIKAKAYKEGMFCGKTAEKNYD
ncbi:MAG: chitobiase/beta-hexosaminidase C-terminal domain-containing protein, partial [Candidatus Delongbacteria bacterium]|nr:chitobiase/beta-hexosaminidase C-terminal domain-containing protein [Candidatus Delongbacteria bacterium]